MKEGFLRRPGLALATASVLAAAACGGESRVDASPSQSPFASPRATESASTALYPLQADKYGQLVDKGLQKKPENGITSVTLFYDELDVNNSGSLRAVVCYDRPTHLRVMSREVTPRPGWLVDAPFKAEQPGCTVKNPVIELGPQDHERVLIGATQTEDGTRNGMLVYDIKTNGFKPMAQRLQNEDGPVDPQMRK